MVIDLLKQKAKIIGIKWLPNSIKSDFQGPFIRIRSYPQIILLRNFSPDVSFLKLEIISNKEPPTHIFVNGEKENLIPSTEKGIYLCGARHFEPWENILAFNQDGINVKILEENEVSGSASELSIPKPQDYKLTKVLTLERDPNIKAAWFFIQNSLNTYPNSQFYGTYYGCYDNSEHTYRLSSWVWCTAAVIKALVQAYIMADTKHKPIWLDYASTIGNTLLERWHNNSNTDMGGMPIRWDISTSSPIGIVPWRAPNDVSFIGSYGFIPLYRITGNDQFLNTSIEMMNWIDKNGFLSDGRLLVGYRDDLKKWDRSWLYVDAGFTTKLFEELYSITQEAYYLEKIVQFTDWYIDAFWSRDGYFRWVWPHRFWNSSKRIFSRGQAWALDGILAAYSATKRKKYLDVANKCSKNLINAQDENGSWHYLLGNKDSGSCNKGTPILAYHLLRLFQITNDAEFKVSAKLALRWCEKNQTLNSDNPYSYGGIFAVNKEGSISGQSNISTSFIYAVAYYIMAKNLEYQLD